jgi:cyclopropane-fatty-acyl-phospholipid synthase
MTRPEAAARRIVLGILSRLGTGTLTLREPDGRTHRFGPGGTLAAEVELHDPRVWTALMRGGRGLAESYADGRWDSPDLVGVIRLAARNATGLDEARRRLAPLRKPYRRLTGAVGRSNTAAQSRTDIHAHYDLGNDLFELMLDDTMMYSAGSFATPDTSLRDASIAKLELVCDKLGLGPDDHVLEIGTGWGGFAVHAATTRGCRVTTTTISAEQHAYAVERAAAAGVSDLVTVLLEDYRDLRGQYGALVSLEMVEAVGWKEFPTFFARCSELLADDGAMLLQAITMDDRAYEVEKLSKSFIRTMIFPNGCLPSQEVIARCVARDTDLRMAHHEDLTADYATTLAHWRANVEANAAQLDALGYDERFRRLWRMYLCYCEGGFAERRIGVGQTLLAKPAWRGRVPATALAPRLGDLEAVVGAPPRWAAR